MQSRRREDFSVSSHSMSKLRGREIELGQGRSGPPRRDLPEWSAGFRRSLSPRKMEEPRRRLGAADRRSSSLERRDYGYDLGGGRGKRPRSRSPPIGLVHKRSQFDAGVSSADFSRETFRGKYEFVDYVDSHADVNTGLKSGHGYNYGSRRPITEDSVGDRYLVSGREISSQKSMVSRDDAVDNLYGLPKDLGHTSKYGGSVGSFTRSSEYLDMGRFKDERPLYPDDFLVDKSSGIESYRGKERSLLYARDASYAQVPVSQTKDSIGSSHFKEPYGTSSGLSRANFQGSYQAGLPLMESECPVIPSKLKEPQGFFDYDHRSSLDSRKDLGMEHKDLIRNPHGAFSPMRDEYQEYLDPRSGGWDRDGYGRPFDEFCRGISTHEQGDYNDKNLLRSAMKDPAAEGADNTEYNYRNQRDSSLLDHLSTQKLKGSNYLGMSISTSRGGDYYDSRSPPLEFGRRMSRDGQLSHFGGSDNQELSLLRLRHGIGRDAGPASRHERMRYSPEFEYEAEMGKVAARIHATEAEELGTYDASEMVFQRTYSEDADISRHNSRNIVSSNWRNTSRMRHLIDRSEERYCDDSSVSLTSRLVGADYDTVSGFDNRLSSHDCMEHVEEHYLKQHKHGGRYTKGHPRPGHRSLNNPHPFNKRYALSKPHNVWIRGKDDNQMDEYENEVHQSEDWMNSMKSEPPEDSNEFKELVHKSFLIFSKKLNAKSVIQKRYKERGKAGSLFCIVCGRSQSKEFTDTNRLAKHAFMSHKFGFRAQHLGLHKAICVLMGWNSEVVRDVITFVPEALPDTKAMAQKEDLIIWPPVIIIHNCSIVKENADEGKVITLEAVGDFLRGKGFSGGKFKMCLGNPENHSVIVVTFLGTFSGLEHAERLHSYFLQNKHGRADYERVASSSRMGKTSSSGAGATESQSMEEVLLYGFMGIAEDLIKIDPGTHRKCWIKSKKEIQDLANAPVRPEL